MLTVSMKATYPKEHYYALCIVAAHGCVMAVLFSFLSIHPDAADHWVWSRVMFNGYLEHPPMVAWMLHYFGLLFSDPVILLKVAPILMWETTYFILYLAVVRLYSERVGLVFLVILLSSPYFFAVVLLFHITTPMMLFFSIFTLLLAELFNNNSDDKKAHENYLLIIGAVLGLALLSKLLTIFFYIALVLFLALVPANRKYFFKWQTYAAPMISLAITIPYILWNIETEWMSFLYQINRGFQNEIDIKSAGVYLISQVAYGVILVPVFWYLFCRKAFWTMNYHAQRLTIFWLALFAVPFILFLYSASTGGHMDIQWLNFGYIGIFILGANFLSAQLTTTRLNRLLAVAFAVNLVVVSIIFSNILFRSLHSLVESHSDRSQDWIDWDKTASDISSLFLSKHQNLPDIIITKFYDKGGALSLYLSNHPLPFSIKKPMRNQWITEESLQSAKGIALLCKPDECAENIIQTEKLIARNLTLLGRSITRHSYSNEVIREFVIYIPE